MTTDQLHLSRIERGQARRAINRLFTRETHEFPSSSAPGVTYTTRIATDGRAYCNCPGWVIRKKGKARQCKHTRALINDRPTRTDGEFIYLNLGKA